MAHGKWWEYMIPGWSGYRMTQDILDPVGTHGGQADKSYDQRVDAAKSSLDNIQKTDPGDYVSAYTTTSTMRRIS